MCKTTFSQKVTWKRGICVRRVK